MIVLFHDLFGNKWLSDLGFMSDFLFLKFGVPELGIMIFRKQDITGDSWDG